MDWTLAHPLLTAAVIVTLAWVTRPLWGGLPSPQQWLRRRDLIARLRRILHYNPHDRDARHRIATELVAAGRHAEALTWIERNIDDGEIDSTTLQLAGIAAFGTRDPETCVRGAAWLERAREDASKVQSVEIDLALARGWMGCERWADARAPLERYLDARPGSVEGLARRGRIHAALGDAQAATAARREAWSCWRAQPKFQRRVDRSWAWRVRPMFGAAQIAVTTAPVAAGAWFVSRIDLGAYTADVAGLAAADPEAMQITGDAAFFAQVGARVLDEMPLDTPVQRIGPPPDPTRFEIRATRNSGAMPALERWRYDLDDDGRVDDRKKLFAHDLLCRMPTEYGPPHTENDLVGWHIHDTHADVTFELRFLGPLTIVYLVNGVDAATAERTLSAFEHMIEDRPLRDCWVEATPGGPYGVGYENGAPIVVWS